MLRVDQHASSCDLIRHGHDGAAHVDELASSLIRSFLEYVLVLHLDFLYRGLYLVYFSPDASKVGHLHGSRCHFELVLK